MMTLGIVYLLTDVQLAARLVVSLYSLRRYYSGPITIFTTRPASHRVGQLCADDTRIRADHEKIQERAGRGYLSSYLTKTAILSNSPYGHMVFLDADTLIVGDISELIGAASRCTVTATTFCDFVTTRDPTRSLIEEWRTIKPGRYSGSRLDKLIDRSLGTSFQSINAGVFAVDTSSSLIKEWDRLTLLGRNMKTPEETALQLLLPDYDRHLLGHHFNCHPFVAIDHHAVRIWHFSAITHLHEPYGADLWLPAYQECVNENVAEMSKWSRLLPRDKRDFTSM